MSKAATFDVKTSSRGTRRKRVTESLIDKTFVLSDVRSKAVEGKTGLLPKRSKGSAFYHYHIAWWKDAVLFYLLIAVFKLYGVPTDGSVGYVESDQRVRRVGIAPALESK